MEKVIRDDGRYPPQAFEFLHEGLTRAVKQVHGLGQSVSEGEGESGQTHVTGRQMCEAMRDEAIERWGLLARPVLERWNIHATIDFGNMVYLLIRHSFMRKTEEDSVEDFRDVYDFTETFDKIDHFELSE